MFSANHFLFMQQKARTSMFFGEIRTCTIDLILTGARTIYQATVDAGIL